MTRWLLFAFVVGWPWQAQALSAADARRLRTVAQELAAGQVETAAEQLEPLKRRYGNDPDVLRVDALVRLHRGDYAGATDTIERSLARRQASDSDDDRPALLELMRSTRDATAAYVESRSSDGRFVVRHAPGRDERLVPYALRALQRADRAISSELGLTLEGPIRLEIYPNARTLAAVSTLTEEAIERTGTIALCKWDRLMVTSPRALLRGYPWMDTISHEYVHLVLTRASRDEAPVWFQEGVAKFLESRWRTSRPATHLRPSVAALLDRAIQQDQLIPFEQLHPSIALLPSQEDAALAFAQVSTFIERFYARYGREGLQAAIAGMADGEDAREALANVAEVSWQQLEQSWRESLRARSSSPGDAPQMLAMRFQDGETDETREVAEAARRAMRLGDLLWARRRYRASEVEYGRALEAAPGDPILSSRLARAALAAGDAERAIEALSDIKQRYPEHAPTWATLAAAHHAAGQQTAARRAATTAIRLNPFDPQPHCVLAEAAESEAERHQEQRQCDALRP